MIRPLAPEVCSRLRSGIATPTVAQCVEELVLNSIDADATCVAVRVDLANYKIQVVDNGCGLCKDEMKLVGERYTTSKCHDVKDLDNLSFFGYRGEALASISHISGVLEIVSKKQGSDVTYSKLFQNGKALNVFESSKQRPSPGTTITVHSVFQNLPVRRKMLSPSLDFERVRKRIQGLALVQPKVSITLRDDSTGAVAIQTHSTSSIANTFGCIFGQEYTKVLKKVEYSKDKFMVDGFIATEGHFNKKLQFMYVNKRFVVKTKLHKLANILLGRSLIGKRKVATEGKDTPKGKDGNYSDLSSPGRSQELHGIFVLNITCSLSDYDITLDPGKTLVEFRNWIDVLQCLEELITDFLNRENLTMKLDKPSDSASNLVVTEVDSSQGGDEESQEEDKGVGELSEEVDKQVSGLSERYGHGIHTSNCSNNLQGLTVRRGAVQNRDTDGSEMEMGESLVEETDVGNAEQQASVPDGVTQCEDKAGGTSDDVTNNNSSDSKLLNSSKFVGTHHEIHHDLETARTSGNLETTDGASSAEEILVIPDSEESVHNAETPLAKCNRVRKLQDSSTPLSAESNSSDMISETEVKDKQTQHHLFAQSDCSAISISSGSDVDDRLFSLRQPQIISKPVESAIGKTLHAPGGNSGQKRSHQFESTTEMQVIPRKHLRQNERYPGGDSSEWNTEVSDGRIPGQKVMTKKLESTEDSEDDMYNTPVGRSPSVINKQISVTHTVSTLSSFRYRKFKEKASLKTSGKSTLSDDRTEGQDSAPYQYRSSLQFFRQSVKSSNTVKARKVQTTECKSTTGSSSEQHISGDPSIPQRGTLKDVKDSAHSASSTQVQCQKVQELVTQPQSHPVQQQYKPTFCDDKRAESQKSKVQEPVITGMTQLQSHQVQQKYRSMYHDESRVESQSSNVLYELHHGIQSRPKETAQNERCAEASSSESNVSTGVRYQKPNLKRLRNQYNLNKDDTTEMSQRKVEQEKACHPVGKRFMTSESFLVTARDVLGISASQVASSATNSQVDVNAEKQKRKEGHSSKPVGVWSVIENDCRKVNSTPSASTSAEASVVPKVQDLSLRNLTRTQPNERVTINPRVYNNQDANMCSGESLEPGHQRHGVRDIGIHQCSEEVLIDHEPSSGINSHSRIGEFDEVRGELQVNSHDGCDSSGSTQTGSRQMDQIDVLGPEELSNRNLAAPDVVEIAVKNVMSRSTHDHRHKRTTESINSEVTRAYDSETDALSQVIQTQRFSPHPVDDLTESSVTSDGSRFDNIPAASNHEKGAEMDTEHSTDVSSVEGTQRFTPGSRDLLGSDLSARDSESDIQEIKAPAELKTSANTQPELDIPIGDTELYQNPQSASRDDSLKIISNCETENSNQATQEREMPNISQVQCQSDKGNSDNSKQNNAACTKPDNQMIEIIDDKVKERQNSASVESINQDWVAHYDPKKGTTLYVNIKSGNCTSEKPDNQDAVEQDGEGRKDFKDGASTSSSVNAFMSSTGHVHPHLSHNATPFLPRTKKQRSCTTDSDPTSSENVCAEGTNEKVVSMVNKHLEKEGDDVASKWREDHKEQNDQGPDQNATDFQELLSDWSNPTEGTLESRILDIRSNQTSGTAIRIHGTLHPYRFTKAMFHNLQVMGQVDNKFIACMVNTDEDSSSEPNLLIMIDQHAAHERVRLEQLTADAYETSPDSSYEDSEESEDYLPTIKASSIIPPVPLTLSAEEIRLIKTFQVKLHQLGVGIDLPDSSDSKGMGCQEVAITQLPACMVEREAHELRRGRQSVALTMVESLVKEQLDLLQDTSGASAVLPKTITKLLNSQACHGAIKFGDKLSVDECVTLVGQLSQCNLPFQCAHGRPSLIPVLDIKMLQSKLQQTNDSDVDMPQLWKLKKKKPGKKQSCQEQQP